MSNSSALLSLYKYQVTYEDGLIEKVIGRWAAHAWHVAQNKRPNHQIKNLSLIGPYEPEH